MFMFKKEKLELLKRIDQLTQRVGNLEIKVVEMNISKHLSASPYGFTKTGKPRRKPGRKPKAVAVKKEEKK